MRTMIPFLRGLVLGTSLHFLLAFLAATLYQAGVQSDAHSGKLEFSESTTQLEPILLLLRKPFGSEERIEFGEALAEPGLLVLCANSIFWGLLVGLVWFLVTQSRPGSKGRGRHRHRETKLLYQIFWLSLIQFLATYTLHLFEMTEYLSRSPNQAVIEVAQVFRFPFTPWVIPEDLWRSPQLLITERFWLMLPNSIVWGFCMALLIRAVGALGRKSAY